jgi:hypothetical protein
VKKMLSRGDFLAHFGGLALASAAVAALPEALRIQGWWSGAYAEDADVVLDTYNGLAAMLWPGKDAYSVSQGEWNDRPGAVAANAGRHTMVALDSLMPEPYTEIHSDRRRVPLSGSIASAINSVALTVNTAATGGAFPSPFARLPFADKAAVWRILEEDTRQVADRDPAHSLGVMQFVFGVLPAFVTNPTLTTQAGATRTAEKIFTLEFVGDPWVGREAPVSSIDPVVTEAVSRR